MFGRAGRLDVEIGLQQIASMLRSGLSLLEALRTAAEQGRGKGASRLWEGIAGRIETGLSLGEAMEAARAFDEYTRALVRVGEQSGELDGALERAAKHMEQERATRAMLANALIYPCLVLVLTGAITVFLAVKVIPEVEEFLLQGKEGLPAITVALLDFSAFVREKGTTLLLGIAAAAAGCWLVWQWGPGRLAWDRLALRVPLTGHLARVAGTAQLARGLSILLESGIPLLDALETSASLLGNRAMSGRVRAARKRVAEGAPLSEALGEAGEFPPMLAKMTAVGEATGTLSATLAETARFHENELVGAVRRLGIFIEPVLILVVGGIVGFVYAAFFLAMFSLAAGGGG